MDVIRHAHEADRLASLYSYDVMDTLPEQTFDALTRLAASICDVPISLISLIDEDRQWFLSGVGIDVAETPRTESVCSDVVALAAPLVVNDLTSVARYATLPAVADPRGVRAYAGVPLIGRDGLPLGALCAIDVKARKFTDVQLAALADLVLQVVIALELHRSDAHRGLNAAAVVRDARQPEMLRRALDAHEFVAFFQPVIDLRTGEVCGLEALLRWQHPTLGILTPDTFLPGLEVGTLVDATAQEVLHQACAVMVDLRAQGVELPDGVAINVSGRQLTVPGLAGSFIATLAQFDLPGSAVRIEVTESAEVTDVAVARDELLALRAAGIKAVADDFGVGWSNLVRLLELPLAGLKIDKQLIDDMVDDPVREHMVNSAITLAHTMGLSVVAEGVERQAVANRLLEMGCERAQGWLFSKAVPAGELPAVLRRYRPAAAPERVRG